MMLLWVALIVVVVVWLGVWSHTGDPRPPRDRALGRYVRGQITIEEYLELEHLGRRR